jgi:competence protein ComEC
MQGGGLVFVFAIPLWAVAFIGGVLISPLYSYISVWVLVLSTLVSYMALHRFPRWVSLVLFGFCCGMVRARWGNALVISDHNIFTAAREFCDGQFARYLEEPYRTLISGILFGGSSGFTAEWKHVFRSTGTMHIIAVSGANVAFVVNWIEWGLKKTIAYPRMRFYAALISIGGYVLMTGAPASVVRAGIMAFVMHVGPLIGRRAYALHALAFAAALMVIINPTIAKDIGFQFSCLATLGLIMFEAPEAKFAGMVSETIAATLCIFPLEIYYFKMASIIALIANIVVAPFIPMLMILGGILLVLSLGPSIAPYMFAQLVEYGARIMLRILATIADIPGSAASLAASFSFVIIWYIVLVVYFVRRCRQQIRAPT